MLFIAEIRLHELVDKYFNIQLALQFLPHLISAAKLAIICTLLGELFGIIIGLFVSLARISHLRILRVPAAFYVNLFRGTPLLVQLMFIYYALPYVDINLPPVVAGVIGLSLNSGAYVSEIFRAGIQSIPKGQMEAARSLGMSYWQAMRFVIIPQAFRIVIPPLTNEFVALLKDSSLLYVIQVPEIAYRMRSLAAASFNATSYVVAALIYLALTIPLTRFADLMEKRLSRYKRT
jgi:polar amino acid transport system permease protein